MQLDRGEISERNQGTGGRSQQDVLNRVDAVSVFFRIPQGQIESFVSLIDAGCRFLPDRRGNNFLNMGDIDTVASDLAAINVDGEVGLAEELFDPHIAHAPDRCHDGLNLFRRTSQHRQIVSEYFYGGFRSDAGQQLIHALLDRLAQQIIGSRHFFNAFADGIVESGFGFGRRPFVHRTESHGGVTGIGFLRIVSHLRAADLGHHHAHFGKLHHGALHLFFNLDGAIQRDARIANGLG